MIGEKEICAFGARPQGPRDAASEEPTPLGALRPPLSILGILETSFAIGRSSGGLQC
jgi:hypothetical protein